MTLRDRSPSQWSSRFVCQVDPTVTSPESSSSAASTAPAFGDQELDVWLSAQHEAMCGGISTRCEHYTVLPHAVLSQIKERIWERWREEGVKQKLLAYAMAGIVRGELPGDENLIDYVGQHVARDMGVWELERKATEKRITERERARAKSARYKSLTYVQPPYEESHAELEELKRHP